jgi:predicted SAM-dependent methyltransferase
MKLHIGSGKKYLEGWVNLDILTENKVDIIDDASKLSKIEDDSCDIIYASHILEHFGRHDYFKVLQVWYSKIKKDGILRIAVPDFESVVGYYNETKDIKKLIGLVSGGQKNSYDYHFMIFDRELLTDSLLKCGFSEVRNWDWRNTEHSEVDDYSQAYLPHMDKENGRLMSLNIEAIK